MEKRLCESDFVIKITLEYLRKGDKMKAALMDLQKAHDRAAGKAFRDTLQQEDV